MRRWAIPFAALLVLVTVGMTAARYLRHPAPPPRVPPEARRAEPPAAGKPKAKPRAKPPTPPPAPVKARVAVVIDDFGSQPALEDRMLDMPVPFTAAIIPHRPHTRAAAERAKARGHEVIIHLPMAPLEASLGEKDAITPGMPPEEVARRLGEALESVPEAAGVNNHQGSRATADPVIMEEVFAVLRDRRLFFLDSLTTNKSVAAGLARRFGVPFISRDVFLDNDKDKSKIRKQLETLANLALQRGWAVGIGHVHPVTARVLEEEIPRLAERGVAVVPLSQLVGTLPEAPAAAPAPGASGGSRGTP